CCAGNAVARRSGPQPRCERTPSSTSSQAGTTGWFFLFAFDDDVAVSEDDSSGGSWESGAAPVSSAACSGAGAVVSSATRPGDFARSSAVLVPPTDGPWGCSEASSTVTERGPRGAVFGCNRSSACSSIAVTLPPCGPGV